MGSLAIFETSVAIWGVPGGIFWPVGTIWGDLEAILWAFGAIWEVPRVIMQDSDTILEVSRAMEGAFDTIWGVPGATIGASGTMWRIFRSIFGTCGAIWWVPREIIGVLAPCEGFLESNYRGFLYHLRAQDLFLDRNLWFELFVWGIVTFLAGHDPSNRVKSSKMKKLKQFFSKL